MNERKTPPGHKASKSKPAAKELSPFAVVSICTVFVLILVIIGGLALRQPARPGVGSTPVPAAIQRQNEQFASQLQSLPPAQRNAYISRNPAAFQLYLSAGTLAQKNDLVQGGSGK